MQKHYDITCSKCHRTEKVKYDDSNPMVILIKGDIDKYVIEYLKDMGWKNPDTVPLCQSCSIHKDVMLVRRTLDNLYEIVESKPIKEIIKKELHTVADKMEDAVLKADTEVLMRQIENGEI